MKRIGYPPKTFPTSSSINVGSFRIKWLERNIEDLGMLFSGRRLIAGRLARHCRDPI